MKTEFSLYGKRFNMAPRRNRRWLVGVLYGTLAALLAYSWWENRTGISAAVVAMCFGMFARDIVGGEYYGKYFLFGSRGLVDPFYGNEILKRMERTDRSKVSRLLLDPPIDDVRNVRSDERSLRSRDYAHFIAFRYLGSVLGLAFIINFLIASVLHESAAKMGLSPALAHKIIFGILQVCSVLSLTLPQCILLWTEPDIETEERA